MSFEIDKNEDGSFDSYNTLGLSTLEANNARSTNAPHYLFYELEPAEVIDIILNENHEEYENQDRIIGKAKVRMIVSDFNKEELALPWAYPLDSNIKNFPLKHEIVIIARYLDRFYYTQKMNIDGLINHNAFPNISQRTSDYFKTKRGNAKEYNQVMVSGTPNVSKEETDINFGEVFKENLNIKSLRPNEGDYIVEGRFGNSIRLSSGENGTPNLKIKVGQPDELEDSPLIEESLTEDKNSIWITTNEDVELSPIPKVKKGESETLSGNQIILASDRIVFNAKLNDIRGYSENNIGFFTNGTYILSTKKEIDLTTETKTILNSPKIFLGEENEDEPIAKGQTLIDIIQELINSINQLTVPTGTGPSGPPINAAQFIAIGNKLKSILSKRNFTL